MEKWFFRRYGPISLAGFKDTTIQWEKKNFYKRIQKNKMKPDCKITEKGIELNAQNFRRCLKITSKPLSGNF